VAHRRNHPRADLDDERYDAPEAAGLDTALRDLSMIRTDEDTLTHTGPLFDVLGLSWAD
jgi:hypothetical protein